MPRYVHSKRVRHALLILGSVLLFGYFLYHTVNGERGILSMMNMQKQVRLMEQELDQTVEAREKLEAKVARLRPESLDPDLLDEQSRDLLNFSRPNEIVILKNEPTEFIPQRTKN
jgi:cell division protein FtsB